jgi:hypothetical protein
MAVKTFVELCATLILTYITIGDIFLPQPYSDSSKQFRSDINQFVFDLLPQPEEHNFYFKKATFKKIEK